MKYKIPAFILLFLSTTAFSQLIDSSYLKIKYKFIYQNDSTNINNKGEDIMILEIGSKTSFFYSYYRSLGDSLLTDDEQNGTYENAENNNAKYYENSWRIKVYKNYPENQITVIEDVFQFYRYTESLIRQDWQIMADTTNLHGLHCQKASTKFRGRVYQAWFTKDIPLQNGPWKFYGLPGLIVRISDSKDQFSFDLTGLDYSAKKRPMIIEEHPDGKNYVKVTRMEMWNLKKQLKEDPIGFLENNSELNLRFTTLITPEQRKARKEPYNPLELD